MSEARILKYSEMNVEQRENHLSELIRRRDFWKGQISRIESGDVKLFDIDGDEIKLSGHPVNRHELKAIEITYKKDVAAMYQAQYDAAGEELAKIIG